jgi:Fe-S-cluster formation regulator IscX/YfhJ
VRTALYKQQSQTKVQALQATIEMLRQELAQSKDQLTTEPPLALQAVGGNVLHSLHAKIAELEEDKDDLSSQLQTARADRVGLRAVVAAWLDSQAIDDLDREALRAIVVAWLDSQAIAQLQE